jgi:tRNA dimethylallyltransferase
MEKILIIIGPTAVGKSRLGIALAKKFGGEIISADSMQAYKGLDIGTAKVPLKNREGIKHHLIDIIEPDERFSAGWFMRLAEVSIDNILKRSNLPIIIGGTGLYIRALLKGLFSSPPRNEALSKRLDHLAEKRGTGHLHRMLMRFDTESAQKITPQDRQRLIRALEVFFKTKKPMSQFIKESPFSTDRYNAIKIGLTMPREKLYQRIEERVEKMLNEGWIEEVERLLTFGYSQECHAFKALGYREIVHYIKGEISLEETINLIKKNTRRYAKRQMTWFRKDEGIFWFDISMGEDTIYQQVEKLVYKKLNNIFQL